MSGLGDHVIDYGLISLVADATRLYICSADPSSYAEALSFGLGVKIQGAGNCFSAPQAGTPTGRAVISIPITDGDITANGIADFFGFVDNINNRLLVSGPLPETQQVTVGNTFQLGAITIRVPCI